MKKIMTVLVLSLCMTLSACTVEKPKEEIKENDIQNKNDKDSNLETEEKVKDKSKYDSNHPATIKVDEYRLDVPQSIQENNYYCGPAVLQMVLQFHGISISQSQLAQELNTSSKTGTEYVDMAKVVNKYLFNTEDANPKESGYRVQTVQMNDSSEDTYQIFEKRVKQDISTNDPVFVAINLKTVYPNLKNANHFVLVTGYATFEGTDNIAYYYIMDPYYLTQNEGSENLKTVTKEILFEAIYSNEEPAYIW